MDGSNEAPQYTPLDHKAFFLTRELADYVASHTSAPDPVLVSLTAQTAALGEVAGMQIAADQGALLTMLTQLVAPEVAIEVGTFTGYSSICIARGLPPGGRLIACDLSDEWTTMARKAWLEAGVADRIDLRLGPAADTLAALPADLVVDFAFIDADKGGYARYYEWLVDRLRPGGLLAVDNVLWSGRVADPDNDEADTVALRQFNDMVVADPRVDVVMVPIADGLSLIRKRQP
jgi:caffeoyl-CoA O-methyltransferase